MTTKTHKALIIAFLDAVNTWKIFVIQVKHANRNNCTAAKRQFMRAMFYWRKKAEALKSELDNLRLSLRLA